MTGLRQKTCLNGTWKLEIEGEEGLHDVRVPGSFAGQYKLWGGEHWNTWDYPADWFEKAAVYHKTLFIPDDLDGRRVLIRFNGVRHMVTVTVNGKTAGTWADSYVPFSFDITELVAPGENLLHVRIGGELTCGLFEDYNTHRRGIYRDCFLQFVPAVRVDNDVHLQTLLREQRILYTFTLRNDGADDREVKLRFRITDRDGNEALRWQEDAVYSVQSQETQAIGISRDWNNPHLWSIDDPYLYHLHTEVLDAATGETVDLHTLRFGFREITWGDAKIFLNGEELYLRGNGDHPMGDLEGGRPFAEAMIRKLKSFGVQCMRMHDLPRHQEMYEAGDEMGFLFIAEAAHHFRLPEPEVGKAHMRRFVRYLRNHPSVMAWSVSNELHWRKFEEPAYLIDVCHEEDATRPAFASDFTPWSRHGDVVSHHYSPESMWDDWLEYGRDKAMIWDELGSIWQHDRALDTGPAGYEIYGQDVATGIYNDAKEVLHNISHFADGKVIDGSLRRVNCYVPWEFGYVFFRFQPFNNMNRMRLRYDDIESPGGIRIDSVLPGASTTNIWDPTLPAFQPNPALYCFKEYLECVRFPDDAKERTYFAGEEITARGRMFYETHTRADSVAFLVESIDGECMTGSSRSVSLKPGDYDGAFESAWLLPPVTSATPARLVRQFTHDGEVIYRQTRDIKLFPKRRPADLLPENTAVVGKALRDQFGTAGVNIADAAYIVTDSMTDEIAERVSAGARVLHLCPPPDQPAAPQTAQIELDAPMETAGKTFTYRLPAPMPIDPEGWFRIRNHQTTKAQGVKFPDQPWWEERDLWAKSPESYQPQFSITLRTESGESFVTGSGTPLTLSRVQQCPAISEEKFMFHSFKWHRDGDGAGETAIDRIPPVSEVILTQTRMCGDEVVGRVQGMEIFGYTRPGAMFPTNGAPAAFLEGLGEEDLARWRGGNCLRNMRTPEGKPFRRFLFGNKNGRGSSLHEWYADRGLVLETSLNLIGTIETEPAAGEFLKRCLDRLAAFEPAASHAPVAIIGDKGLADCWKGPGVVADHLADPRDISDRRLVMVGASTLEDAARIRAWSTRLREAAAGGATVLFTPVTEHTIDAVREATGRSDLALTEPFFGKRTCCIKAPVSWARVNTPEILTDYYDGVLVPYPFEPNFSPLLSGISNIDLNWGGRTMFSRGIELKGMDPVASTPEYSILISNWHINAEPGKSLFGEMLNGVRDKRQNAWFTNRDPVVLQVRCGNGSFLFNQLHLENGGEQAARVMTQLLTQLGAVIGGAAGPDASAVYDENLQAAQYRQFEIYAKQIEPGRREHYGIPSPMPDYLKQTRIDGHVRDALPSLGFVGDDLALQLSASVAEKLSDVLQSGTNIHIETVRGAAETVKKLSEGVTWDRLVLSVGSRAAWKEHLPPGEFAAELKALYRELKPRTGQLFWLPPAPVDDRHAEVHERARAYRLKAEEVFGRDEVYMIPFVYDHADRVLHDFLNSNGQGFELQEVRDLSDALASAVRSFGAM